jgi:hypothetical protein
VSWQLLQVTVMFTPEAPATTELGLMFVITGIGWALSLAVPSKLAANKKSADERFEQRPGFFILDLP